MVDIMRLLDTHVRTSYNNYPTKRPVDSKQNSWTRIKPPLFKVKFTKNHHVGPRLQVEGSLQRAKLCVATFNFCPTCLNETLGEASDVPHHRAGDRSFLEAVIFRIIERQSALRLLQEIRLSTTRILP
jgi:hypothetical protein